MFFFVLFVGRDAVGVGRGVDGTGVIGRISSDDVYALDGEGGLSMGGGVSRIVGRIVGRLGGL